MKKTLFLFIVLCAFLSVEESEGQVFRAPDLYSGALTSSAFSGEMLPFWMTSNYYGKRLPYQYSSFASARVISRFRPGKGLPLDVGYGVEGIARYSQEQSAVYPHQLYMQAKYRNFILRAGMKERNGRMWDKVATGNVLHSYNARPVPKVVLKTRGYNDFPGLGSVLSYKAGYSEGLLEKDRSGWVPEERAMSNPFLHQKYAYARANLGKQFKLSLGLRHSVLWGGEYGNIPEDKIKEGEAEKKYLEIITGGIAGNLSELGSGIDVKGVHMLSRELGISFYPFAATKIKRLDEIRKRNTRIRVYWQTLDNSLSGILQDDFNDAVFGLEYYNALSGFQTVERVVVEYISADMEGQGYFAHSMYNSGYTHFGYTLGTPFITSPVMNSNGAYNIQNNSMMAIYMGINGGVGKISRITGLNRNSWVNYKFIASYSKNYGLAHSYETPKDSFSFLFGIDFPLRLTRKYYLEEDNFYINVGLQVASDIGGMYGDNIGALLKLSKRLDLRAPEKAAKKGDQPGDNSSD